MLNDEMPKGAIDMPDERDYFASHILGSVDGALPEEVKFKVEADNQGKSVKCTCYSTYHVGRILNELEHNRKLEGLPDVGWELQKKFGTHSKQGDYVQTAVKSVKKNGIHCKDKTFGILGYARIKNDEIKKRLAQGFPIITSSNVTKTNFKKAKHEGIWGGDDGDMVAGHAFALIGYEAGYVWALNSYGPDWGYYGDGTFKIREKDLRHLGSKYILYDEKDIQHIFRDVTSSSPFAKEIEWALEEELMKGYESESLPSEKRFFKPEQSITRAEMAAVLYRFKKKYY
jgi:hypothetical protein